MKRKQFLFFEWTAVTLLVVVSFWSMLPRFLDAQNINTPENFPDPNFRCVVEKNMGVDEGERFSALQAANKKRLILYRQGISKTKGIEFFTGLEFLKITNTKIEALDLSRNIHLEYINCEGNFIKSIRLFNHEKLRDLICSNNQIVQIEVSMLPGLKRLDCSNNGLKEIDVSQNLELTRLDISSNFIDTLDVNQNKKLAQLSCSRNPLTVIDLSKNSEMIILNARECEFEEIDLLSNSKLFAVNLQSNQLTSFPKVVDPKIVQVYSIENNNLDCEDWQEVMEYQSLQGIHNLQLFSYSPQERFDPYDCSEMNSVNEKKAGY